MRTFRRGSRRRSLLLLLFLGATPLTGMVGESQGDAEPGVEVLSVAPATDPGDPTGTGVWERAGCILCAAGFLAAGGTSILGVAVTAIALPELAAACGMTCAYAFG